MKRPDGILLRHTDPMYRVAVHLMTKRSDAMNAITLDIPYEPIRQYVRDKKKQGIPMSNMTVILAGLVRLTAEYPPINRFVMNKRVYTREKITVGMVVMGSKKGEGTANEGTMSKIIFEPTDNIFQINEKIEKYIAENRVGDNSAEKIIHTITSIPGVLRGAVNLIRWTDKHNLLPKMVIDASPFHCTMLFTNLASIRTNHIYHHIYDFGTTSMSFAMGNPRMVPKQKNGEVVFEHCIPLGMVMDDRTVSGHYFATAFHRLKQLYADPSLMEVGLPAPIPDPEL
nr:hypothetical protein [Lachnospiraceae bacterium]